MFKYKVIAYIIMISFFISCENKKIEKKENIIVELNGKTLHKHMIDSLFVKSISYTDSIAIAQSFIENWVKDQLLYEKALENIKEKEWINNEVEKFKKELITSRYISSLVLEEFADAQILDAESEEFYNENQPFFILDRSMVKGFLLKIPEDAPGLKEIKKKIKVIDEESLDIIDKYSLQNAINYEYFLEKWIPYEMLTSILPLEFDIVDKLKSNTSYESVDNGYWYYIYISEYLKKGENEPYEISKDKISDLLLQKKMKEYLSFLRNDLYEEAKEGKKINYPFLNNSIENKTE